MFPGPLPWDDLLRQQQRELNVEKRKAIWKDIQIKWAENVLDLQGYPTGVSDVLDTAQPWFANRGAVTTPQGVTINDSTLNTRYWYDATLKS